MTSRPKVRLGGVVVMLAVLLLSLLSVIPAVFAAGPSISISDAAVFATTTAGTTTNMVFTISLSSPSALPITLVVQTADDTATGSFIPGAGDYDSVAPTTVTIPANTGSINFSVTANANVIIEPDETFFVNLSSPTNATILDGNATGTILDAPAISINDMSVIEGNAGPTNIVFTVSLAHNFIGILAVDFADTFNTATAGVDYVSPCAGTVTFPLGSTQQQIICQINGDTLNEADETFFVDLANPSPAVAPIAKSRGVGTIVNDDGAPVLSLTCPTPVAEAIGSVICTVNLTPVSGQTVTVNYTTADGTATAPADYTSTSGTLTFAPATISQPITVPIINDALNEAAETFSVNLSAPTNATIASGLGSATITITDNDPVPTLSIGNATVTEGDSGTVSMVFPVSLSAASGQTVKVDYASADGTATAPSDYTAVPPPIGAALIFPPGVTAQNVTVTIKGDTTDEDDETLFVNLSGAVNATILNGQGVGTILDDDNPPTIAISDASVTEGNSGTTNADFTVSLSAASGKTVTVNAATADGTATGGASCGAGVDYIGLPATPITFLPGQTSKPITIQVCGDTTDEDDETFFVNLSGPVNATILNGQGVGTILDDDNPPTIAISDASVTEGNSGTTNADFTVSLSAASGKTVTVNVATADGTATGGASCGAGVDYIGLPATPITFLPGQTSKPIIVQVCGDTTDEDDETFFVDLSSPVNATVADGQGVGTILDDDNPPTISIGDATVTEGNVGNVAAVFSLALSAPSGKTITVDYCTADDTAAAPGDYTTNCGTVTFTPGLTTQNITVVVNADVTDEFDEFFFVDLTHPINVTVADGHGKGTILDDDLPPTVAIGDCSVTEGDIGTVDCVFTVSLSAPSEKPISVDYATADGTAVAPGDYVAKSGTLNFPLGTTSQTIAVTINGDTIDENDETFTVGLTSLVNVSSGDLQGTGTIVDNDPPPSVSIGDCSVTEGNSGTTGCDFTVTLSAASEKTVVVDYTTANGTAVAPGDYAPIGTTSLTFLPGVTSRVIPAQVNGDTTDEDDEQFFVNLSAPVNATIGDGQGQGTIVDDDAPPTVSIGDATVSEGSAGTVSAVFSLSLSAASGKTVTVSYATANNSADAGTDYVSVSGSLTFPPGVTIQNISVVVNGDTLPEPTETFNVNLSSPANVTIADGQGVGTILDGGNPPLTITIGDATVTEGDSGTANTVFTVSLSAVSSQPVTVDYATANDTAVAPGDYTAKSGTLTFAPGQTTQNITILVKGDTTDEDDETFLVNLSNAAGAIITTGQGIGTITDDDAPPTMSIGDCTVTEGDSGSTACVFTVSLSAASGKPITASYASADGTAIAPDDYAARSGPLTFPVGTTSLPITVLVNGDTTDENDETFNVNLSSPTNATIAGGQGVGTITDDDLPPTVGISDCAVTEGDSGSVPCVFTVALSARSGKTITLTYTSADGSASSGSDYTAQSGTLTFPAGVITQEVALSVQGDTLDEPDETFVVNLSNTSNATIGDGQGVGLINDDDAPPTISIGDANVVEGNTGTVDAVFSVSLSAASAKPITITYATLNNSATAPGDYAAIPLTTISIPPGTTTKNVTVQVNGDIALEPNETFFVNLSNPANTTILDGQGVGTIINDDISPVPLPTLAISDVSVAEGNTGTVNATFTVSLSAASLDTVTVAYHTTNGGAIAGSDFVARTGTVTFAPGQTSQPITVQVTGDRLQETDETFFVDLSDPVNATILDGRGAGTISNDDRNLYLGLIQR